MNNLSISQKTAIFGIAVYLILITLYSIYTPIIELLVISGFIYCIKTFYDKKIYMKNYNIFKYFVNTIPIIWVFSVIGRYVFLEENTFTLFENIITPIPSLIIGSTIGLTIIKFIDKIELNLDYLYFISVGMGIAHIFYGVEWLGFYVCFWMLLETIIFASYALFDIKIPFFKGLYNFVRK